MLDPVDREGLGEGGGDTVGDRDRLLLVGEAVDEDAELVAAEAGDDVAGAQVGAQARCHGTQQSIAGVVAEAVVDQLEVVEVEEEDPDRRAGGGRPVEGLVEGVDEAEPVRQPGQGVVQDAVAQRLVGGMALDRVGEDVGGRLDEGDVLGAEAVRLGRVQVEHPERMVLAVDHHRQAAGGGDDAQHRRHREAGLGVPVGDDRVGAGVESGTGVGVEGGGDTAAGADDLALEPGAQVEAAAVAAELPDAGALDAVDFGDQLGRGPQQRLGVAVLQRPLAELGDHGLLGDGLLQLRLGALALGDVVEDAVPDRDAFVVGLQDRFVEHPDDLAGPGAQPVLDRPRAAIAEVDLGFVGQRRLAILGMQEPGPETGVGLELLGGVAEDLLDLGADVMPLAVLAHFGGVDDHRQALDQAPVVLAAGGYLVEKFVDLVIGPVPIPLVRHRLVIDTSR